MYYGQLENRECRHPNICPQGAYERGLILREEFHVINLFRDTFIQVF